MDIQKAEEFARHIELSLMDNPADEFTTNDAANLIRSRDKAIIERCKDKIMGGSFLSHENPEYKWAVQICGLLDDTLSDLS